jgi:hypothetical protein
LGQVAIQHNCVRAVVGPPEPDGERCVLYVKLCLMPYSCLRHLLWCSNGPHPPM